MTVLMFQPRFAPKVQSGAKTQTIRPERKRPIKVGDRLSLRRWTGLPYRTPQQVLQEAVVLSVKPVKLTVTTKTFWDGESCVSLFIRIADTLLMESQMDLFAKADGFASVAEMSLWFMANHELRPSRPFTGICIKWKLAHD